MELELRSLPLLGGVRVELVKFPRVDAGVSIFKSFGWSQNQSRTSEISLSRCCSRNLLLESESKNQLIFGMSRNYSWKIVLKQSLIFIFLHRLQATVRKPRNYDENNDFTVKI